MPPKKTGNPKQKKEPSIAQNKTKPKPRKQVVKGNLHPTEGLTCEACGGVLPVWIIRTDGIGGGDLSLYKPAGFAGAPKLFLLCLRCKCIGNDCPELAERALPGADTEKKVLCEFHHELVTLNGKLKYQGTLQAQRQIEDSLASSHNHHEKLTFYGNTAPILKQHNLPTRLRFKLRTFLQSGQRSCKKLTCNNPCYVVPILGDLLNHCRDCHMEIATQKRNHAQDKRARGLCGEDGCLQPPAHQGGWACDTHLQRKMAIQQARDVLKKSGEGENGTECRVVGCSQTRAFLKGKKSKSKKGKKVSGDEVGPVVYGSWFCPTHIEEIINYGGDPRRAGLSSQFKCVQFGCKKVRFMSEEGYEQRCYEHHSTFFAMQQFEDTMDFQEQVEAFRIRCTSVDPYYPEAQVGNLDIVVAGEDDHEDWEWQEARGEVVEGYEELEEQVLEEGMRLERGGSGYTEEGGSWWNVQGDVEEQPYSSTVEAADGSASRQAAKRMNMEHLVMPSREGQSSTGSSARPTTTAPKTRKRKRTRPEDPTFDEDEEQQPPKSRSYRDFEEGF